MITGGLLGTWNNFVQFMRELNLVTVAVRLLLAMAVGAIVGADRGMKRRVAGVKTHTIVCLGATMAMLTGEFIHLYSNGAGVGDTARLGAQVISGVVFFGCGNHCGDGESICFRFDHCSQSVDLFLHWSGYWLWVLQRSNLGNTGSYDCITLSQCVRLLCGKPFQCI